MEGCITRLGEHLGCPICQDTLVQPVTLPCQHDCCLKCVEGMMSKGPRTRDLKHACPMCTQEFHVTDNKLPRVNKAMAAAADVYRSPPKAGYGLNRVKRAVELFSCSTCKGKQAENPELVQTPCGHIFCLGCLTQRLNNVACSRGGGLRPAQVVCSVCSANLSEFMAHLRQGHKGMGPVLSILQQLEKEGVLEQQRQVEQLRVEQLQVEQLQVEQLRVEQQQVAQLQTEQVLAEPRAQPEAKQVCLIDPAPRPSRVELLHRHARVKALAEPPEEHVEEPKDEVLPVDCILQAKRSRKSPDMLVNQIGASWLVADGAILGKRKAGKMTPAGREPTEEGAVSKPKAAQTVTASRPMGGATIKKGRPKTVAAPGQPTKPAVPKSKGVHKPTGRTRVVVISAKATGQEKKLQRLLRKYEKKFEKLSTYSNGLEVELKHRQQQLQGAIKDLNLTCKKLERSKNALRRRRGLV